MSATPTFNSDLSYSSFLPLDAPDAASKKAAIIRSNNPPPGIAGFVFNIPEDEVLRLRTAISDHYLEDNTAVADQMALEPERFTVRGLQGELAAPPNTPAQNSVLVDRLPAEPDLEPEFTPGAMEDMADAKGVNETQIVPDSLFSYYNAYAADYAAQTKQTVIARYFYDLWKSRQRFTVETPWGFFTDMAIEDAVITQPEDSRFYSKFEITFKKMRISSVTTVTAGQLAGRLNQQMAPTTQVGQLATKPATAQQKDSLLNLLSGGFTRFIPTP